MSNNSSLLINGDCLETMKTISSNSIDAAIFDPPYGTTRCKWDSVIPLDLMWEGLSRVVKKNGVIAIMANEPFTSALICSNLKQFKYRIDWKKNKSTGFLNAKKQPLRCIEDICIFYTAPPTYNPQMSLGHKPVNSYTKNTSDGETIGKTKIGIKGGGQTTRYPTNLIEFPVVNNDGSGLDGKRLNPTQKPIALMEYLIKTFTNKGDTILDPTMGSGTTGKACRNLQRSFVGIEKDKDQFKKAKNRIEGE